MLMFFAKAVTMPCSSEIESTTPQASASERFLAHFGGLPEIPQIPAGVFLEAQKTKTCPGWLERTPHGNHQCCVSRSLDTYRPPMLTYEPKWDSTRFALPTMWSQANRRRSKSLDKVSSQWTKNPQAKGEDCKIFRGVAGRTQNGQNLQPVSASWARN